MCLSPCIFLIIFTFIPHLIGLSVSPSNDVYDQTVRAWLAKYDKFEVHAESIISQAEWDYNTNTTEENTKKLGQVNEHFGKDTSKFWNQSLGFDINKISDVSVKREIHKIQQDLHPDITVKMDQGLENQVATMEKDFSSTKISFTYRGKRYKDLTLEDNVTKLMLNSQEPGFRLLLWDKWNSAIGRKLRNNFIETVKVENEYARANNFSDVGHKWRAIYGNTSIFPEIKVAFTTILPLYKQLHSYIGRALSKVHGSEFDKHSNKKYFKSSCRSDREPKWSFYIPAHLIGDIWSQTWDSVYQLTSPFPDQVVTGVEAKLNNDPKISVHSMVEMAEQFFVSIGFRPMTPTFWNRSIFVKPNDGRTMICHAAAFNLFARDDYRLRMCAQKTFPYFHIIHHEMGHIAYYMSYSHLHMTYRNSPTPAIHEAIGDLIGLYSVNLDNLKGLGLLDEGSIYGDGVGKMSASKSILDNTNLDVNHLYYLALRILPAFVYTYILELWRYEVFKGEIPFSEMNEAWWHMRETLQGVTSPTYRSDEQGYMDPGAKYHVASFIPYIRYFMSHIIVFQFFKRLCLEVEDQSGKPLYKCNIKGSLKAGKYLKGILSKGGTIDWRDILFVLNHPDESIDNMVKLEKGGLGILDIGPMIEFFKPLSNWFEENEKDL